MPDDSEGSSKRLHRAWLGGRATRATGAWILHNQQLQKHRQQEHQQNVTTAHRRATDLANSGFRLPFPQGQARGGSVRNDVAACEVCERRCMGRGT